MQGRLKKHEKSRNQFQNELMRITKKKKKTSKKKTKAGFFSNQKNTKYSEEYIAK